MMTYMRLPSRSAALQTVLFAVLTALPALAQAAPADAGATADEVMAHAKTQAAAEHKNILLVFGASWCINCRLFDKFLADPAIHPIMDKAFVFVDMNTGEHASDKKHANLPGGEKLQSSLGGKDAGWPYIVMLTPTGKLLADANRPANLGHEGNIGYPAAPYEIDWFIEMLKRSDPALTAQDAATVRDWLTSHKPH